MRQVTGKDLSRSGWIILLLLAAGTFACDSTAPGSGGSAGGLALVTSTAGIQTDGDGYTVMVDGTARGSIGPNDSLTVPGVDAGTHAIELSDIEFNCATLGQFTQTVTVSADADAVVDYSVACDALSRSRIAFVKDQSTNPEIFLMNADGSELTSLKDSIGAVQPQGMLLSPVAWSADGNRVAFTRAGGGMYATTGDGAGVVQLAPSGMSPSWSEDGRKVAFLAADPGTELCCWDIFVAESNGSGVTQVTEGLSLLDFSFAANGSLLAHVVEINARGVSVAVVRPDGTGRREIAPPGLCCFGLPALSPDGTKVAYSAYDERQGENGPGYEIYVSPTDGSGPTINLSDNPEEDYWPVWSPDGSKIAFVSAAQSYDRGSIHVVKGDGTDQIAVTPDDFFVWQPAWSPEGTRIAYSGAAPGFEGHIFVANADGSGRTDIGPNSDSYLPTWTGR